VRQTIVLRQGVDANLARQLIREIKDSKLKVQVSIQGDELRITARSATIFRRRSPWSALEDRAAVAVSEFSRITRPSGRGA